MSKFKTHMLLYQSDEGFLTACGINDGCSNSFFESANLVEYGKDDETTCKRCITAYRKDEKYFEDLEAEFSKIPDSEFVSSDDDMPF